MGGESPRAIKHPAVLGLDSLRAPVTVVGEVLGCQRVRDSVARFENDGFFITESQHFHHCHLPTIIILQRRTTPRHDQRRGVSYTF